MAEKKRGPTPPTSFRLSAEDKAVLKEITAKVNAQSRRRISEREVLQALIQIGSKTPPATILKALRALI
jgi:hypothetical protein